MSIQSKMHLICIMVIFVLGQTGCDSTSITSLSPDLAAAQPSNTLQQGDFENGIDAWGSCSEPKLPGTTTDTPYGNSAARLTGQACIYQTLSAQPDDSHQLTCMTQRSGIGWAALMLAYLDVHYEPVATTETEVVHLDFNGTTLGLSAPAKAAYVEVLAYSTGDANLTLDNCTLESVTDAPVIVSNPVVDNLTPTVSSVKRSQSFGTDPNDIDEAGQIDWSQAWMVHNSLSFWVAWETWDSVPTDSWGLGIYLDIDQNPNTGFRGFANEYPIGADYLIEGVEQFNYTGNGNNWSWELAAQVGTAANEKSAIRSIPLQLFGNPEAIDLFFRADNTAVGGKSVDYYPDNVIDTAANPASRYFTYETRGDVPPVIVDPPPPVTPPPSQSTIASIDVRNGMEGADLWTSSGPFDYEISVINSGLLPLTNVTVSSDTISDCQMNYTSLAVGETKSLTCTNATRLATTFTHIVTATATASDGQIVSDADASSNRGSPRLANRQAIVVTPDDYGAIDGDDITFTVEVANNGNSSVSNVTSLTSNVADCVRQFDPPVATGKFERYSCVAPNVTVPFKAEFNTRNASAEVKIIAAGTSNIDISVDGEGQNFRPVRAAQPTINISLANTGAVELLDVAVTNEMFPDCSKEFALLRPGVIETYNCRLNTELAGGAVLNNSITITGTDPDGVEVIDTDTTTMFHPDDFKIAVTIEPLDGLVVGNPGEQATIQFSLENHGYVPVTSLESLTMTKIGISDTEIGDCESVLTTIAQDPDFRLDRNQSRQYSCAITIPNTLTTTSDTAYLFIKAAYASDSLPGYTSESEGEVKIKKFFEQGQPATAITIVNTAISTDPSAKPNPVINQTRIAQLMTWGDLETLGPNGAPAGWEKGCNGSWRNIITGEEQGHVISVEIAEDSCLTYPLSANDLARLAGNSFKLSCSVRKHTGYTSAAIVLNGLETSAVVMGGATAVEITGNAASDISDGYVSLYAAGRAVFDDCELLILNTSDSVASINIRNQAEGVDHYRHYGNFDFELAVTNDGSVALNDVEISSNKLQCDTNFDTLQVNETKTILCSTSVPLTHWDQVFGHTALATAVTDSGEIVADNDHAAYGGTLGLAGDYVKVTVNSQDISTFTAATPGSNVDLRVEISRSTYSPIRLITSSIPSCNRIIEPTLQFGDTISYNCTIENIQADTLFEINLIPDNGNFSSSRRYQIPVE